MKVKNIAFSGFMAAILMGATGAQAAINVASKAYVDKELGTKADAQAVATLENTVTSNKTEFDTYVTNNNAAVALKADQSALDTLSQTVVDNKSTTDAAIALKADKSALDTLAGNVYTKEAADALLANKVDNQTLENYYTRTETYTDDQIEQRISETLTSLEGGNINLGGYAKTDYVDTELAKKAEKSVVDGIVTALGTTTDVTAAIADAKKAGTDAQGEVDALEGVVSTLSQTVATNKSEAESYADQAELDAIAAAQGYTDDAISDMQVKSNIQTDTNHTLSSAEQDIKYTSVSYVDAKVSSANANVTELQQTVTANKNAQDDINDIFEKGISDNAAAIATNAENITKKQDALDADQLAAASSGVTAEKVGKYDAAVSELADSILMPDSCKQENGNCVLGITGGKVQWIDLTEPVDDAQPGA